MNCKKCKKSYSKLEERIPRILISCGHTMCQQCIKTIHFQQSLQYITCIQCSKTSIGKSYQSFPINATLINLMDPQTLCKIHRLKLQAYCQKDRQLLCVSCVISNQHKSHKVCPISEVVEKDRNILKNSIDKITISKEELKCSFKKIQQNIHNANQQYKDYLFEIGLFFKSVRSDIGQIQKRLLQDGQKVIDDFLRKMQDREKEIIEKQKFIKELQSLYNQVMQLNDIQYLSQQNKRLFILQNSKTRKIKIQQQHIEINKQSLCQELVNLFIQRQNRQRKQGKSGSPVKGPGKQKRSKNKQPAVLEVNLSEQYRKHYGNRQHQNSDRRNKQVTLFMKNSQQKIELNEENKNILQSKSQIHLNEQKFSPSEVLNDTHSKFNSSFSAVSSIQSFMETSHASLLNSLKDSQSQFTLYPYEDTIYHFGGYLDNNVQHFKLDHPNDIIEESIKIGRNKCQCLIMESYSSQKCLIIGGKSNKSGERLNSILSYNLKTHCLQKTNLNLSEAKSGFWAISKQSKLYVVGGCSENPLSSFEEYTFVGGNLEHKKLTNMSYPRDQLGGVWGLDGNIYACGGINQRNVILNTCQRFNWKTQKWDHINSMNIPRRSFTLIALPNCLMAIGGHDGKNYITAVQKYSYLTGKWTFLKEMLTPRCTHTSIVSSDYQTVWICGGFKNQPLRSIEVYNVMDNQWKSIGNMKEQRFLHCSILYK